MDAAVAADRLEHLAGELRSRMRPGDQMRWEAKIWHWNESWNDPTRTFDLDRIITSEALHSGLPPEANRKARAPNEPS